MKQLNDQYFNYRQTPVDYDGIAKPSIKGNTLVWNQLVQNGNFADTSWWGFTAGTLTVSNNIGTFKATAQWQSVNKGWFNNAIPQGRKLLCIATVKSYTANNTYFMVRDTENGVSSNVDQKVLGTTKQTYSFIHTRSSGTTGMQLLFQDNNSSGWGNIEISNVMLFDLTQMFGSGNEPTIDEFTSLFPLSYAYDSGSLLNFNGSGIKTTGFNQWDEEWEVGSYTSAGIKNSSTIEIRNKNFIPVMPNTQYYFNSPVWGVWYAYDEDKNLISRNVANPTPTAFVTPSNCHYINFYLNSRYGTTYNNDICINISDTERNGTYEPYTTSTLSLPVSTYFPTGMKSAGSVYDELSDKAITRVGSVDLGSLTWQRTATQDASIYRFMSNTTLSDYKTVANSAIGNLKSIYTPVSADSIYSTASGDKVIGTNASGTVIIRDDSYTDADAFKTAMSGVYLNYELATYTEQSAEDIYYDFYGNGTEQLLPVNTDTPSTSPLLADIIYYNLTDSEVPYRVFWMINSKGERWDFTEREFKSFLNNPQGLGFSKTFSVNRYGNVQNLTDITDNFPQPNGEVLFYDSSNSTRYDKYNNFVKFLSYEPITLYYKIPVSFFSRIPNTYSLECVVGTLSKTESKTDHMLTCSINYNALSFYKGEEVEISGTGLTYTINNDGDFPVGFEIMVTGSLSNPFVTLEQDDELYGEAKFIDDIAFSKIYINSNDGEQSLVLEQGGSAVPNPMSYQDLSISNGSIYVTFVKLARGESKIRVDGVGTILGVTIRYTPIYRSV